jgi:hypothetical protein
MPITAAVRTGGRPLALRLTGKAPARGRRVITAGYWQCRASGAAPMAPWQLPVARTHDSESGAGGARPGRGKKHWPVHDWGRPPARGAAARLAVGWAFILSGAV